MKPIYKYILFLLIGIIILFWGIFFYVSTLNNAFKHNYINGWEDCVNQTGLLKETLKNE